MSNVVTHLLVSSGDRCTNVRNDVGGGLIILQGIKVTKQIDDKTISSKKGDIKNTEESYNPNVFLNTNIEEITFESNTQNKQHELLNKDLNSIIPTNNKGTQENEIIHIDEIEIQPNWHTIDCDQMLAIENLKQSIQSIITDYGFASTCSPDAILSNKANCMITLATTLLKNTEELFYETNQSALVPSYKNKIDLNQFIKFKENCETLLRDHNPAIDKHRASWKVILANILIALTVVGLLFQIYKLVKGVRECSAENKSPTINRCLFFGATQSEKRLMEVRDSINMINFSPNESENVEYNLSFF